MQENKNSNTPETAEQTTNQPSEQRSADICPVMLQGMVSTAVRTERIPRE